MSKKETTQPNQQQIGKNTIIVTPTPAPAIDLSKGQSGYKGPVQEDAYFKGAPGQTNSITPRKKKKKKKSTK